MAADWRKALAELNDRARRHGPALLVSLAINGTLIGVVIFNQPRPAYVEPRPIQVFMLPREPKPPPVSSQQQAEAVPKAPQWRIALPPPPTLPSAPAPIAAPAPAANVSGQGAGLADLDRAVVPRIGWLRACAGGDLSKLPPAARARCENAWSRVRETNELAPRLLVDPNGEFGDAVAKAEARRTPMKSPVRACSGDDIGGNLGGSCPNN